jgi:hypothetical protein
MVMPANLFIDAPDVQDVSLSQLSNEMEIWPEEIIQKFKERIPESTDLNIMVKFMKKDEENGTATGSIIVNGADRAAIIPIIIKDFMLFPLDVMIAKGRLLPLTPTFFAAIFQKGELFQAIEEYPTYGGLGRFEDANLWNATYPPSMGRYAYASANYPILDSIADTIKNASELKTWLVANPNHYVAFRKNGHVDLLQKLANLQAVNMSEYAQGRESLIPRNIAVLRREGPDKYTILRNSDTVFSPAITPDVSYHDCMSFVSKLTGSIGDAMNEVDRNGEKLLMLPAPKDNVVLARTDSEIAESADSFDSYAVMSNTGVTVLGQVIPKVIDFDQKTVNLKIFLGKTMQTMQPEIWGVRLKNGPVKIQGSLPAIGQTGTFVYQPEDSHALCTIPVTVVMVSSHGPCGLTLKVTDLMGRPLRLRTSREMDVHRIALLNGEYLLPGGMKWVPMSGFSPVSSSAESYAVKIAGAKITDRPVSLLSTGFGQFSMKGVDKYASALGWDRTNLHSYQAKFILASLGCGEKQILGAIKHAQVQGKAELHNLNFPPLMAEKIAEKVPTAEKLVKLSKLLRHNLFKEASYIDNAQTVDALLALNFVNPDNIAKFIGKIPQLKSAISTLASCVLASRVGMKEIPEEATATAMHRLIEVVEGLEKLRAAKDIAPS